MLHCWNSLVEAQFILLIIRCLLLLSLHVCMGFMLGSCFVVCSCIRESLAQFENRIKPRVCVRRITRSTMNEKAQFC